MATQAQVRRIALSFRSAVEESRHFAFAVPHKGKLKGFVWVWMERVTPKKPRVANFGVIAVRVSNVAQRDLLISADPMKFFTEPHYAGFPAVLVRLEAVTVSDLRMLFADAWRTQATPELLAKLDESTATVPRTARRGGGAVNTRRAR